MPKTWRLKKSHPKLQAQFASELSIHSVVALLLVNRGITDVDTGRVFLNPRLEDLHDPFLLKNMEQAVERLRRAREHHEKVMVYGDYDVDGVTSTAVLWRALRKFGMEAVKYIPHRMEEGYGLNMEIVPLAKDMGVTLLITVDCGVTSFAETLALKQVGIDTIVIDHHEPEEGKVPEAAIVIDPKQSGCTYPSPWLAGVGLAAKFAQAFLGEFPLEDLDLVTLGTIADVSVLKGENRIFARHGLPMIMKTKKAGLKALIQSARIEGKPASTHMVGFVLGPRLNAAGRMGSANTALDLLLSEDEMDSANLAYALESLNRDRQKLQSVIVDAAMAVIESESLSQDKVLVVHGEDWHKGVLGIAASKVSERYGRPAIVISFESGRGVGSARSIEGFCLDEALLHCTELLETFGGHKRAAGLKIQQGNIVAFRERINAFAAGVIEGVPQPILEIDAELPLPQIEMGLIRALAGLEPHGEGNPAPLFATRRLMLKSRPQAMGKDTIKFWVTDGRSTVSAVGFGMASEFAHLRMGQAVDIAYTLGIDDWNKAPQPQIILKDIRVLTK